MKWLIAGVLVMAFASTASAQLAPVYVDPTLPGSTLRDYSRPSYVIQGGTITPTVPGTYLPDQRRGGYVIHQPYGRMDPYIQSIIEEPLYPRHQNKWTIDLDD